MVEASSLCASRYGKDGLKTICIQLSACITPSIILKPAGVCIHEFRLRIQNADIVVPRATRDVAIRWTRSLTRPRPNSMMPRKLASRKKAVSTS